jgi:uncharacterized protein YjbI with pentapeptide repeats
MIEEELSIKNSLPLFTPQIQANNDLIVSNSRLENFDFGQNDFIINININNCLFTQFTFENNENDILSLNIQNSFFKDSTFTGDLYTNGNNTSNFINNIFDTCTFRERSNFHHSNFTNSKIVDSTLEAIDLNNVNLTNAIFNNVNLTDSDLTDANLTNAIFNNVNLTDSDLTDADLTNATFNNVNFTKTNLTHIPLNNVNINNETCYFSYLGNNYLFIELNRSNMENLIKENIIHRSLYKYINILVTTREQGYSDLNMIRQVLIQKLPESETGLSVPLALTSSQYLNSALGKKYASLTNDNKTEKLISSIKQKRRNAFNETRFKKGGKKTQTKKTKKNRKQKTKKRKN